jgi:gamma-glutamyltranspeptidase/glutathione hydrolase
LKTLLCLGLAGVLSTSAAAGTDLGGGGVVVTDEPNAAIAARGTLEAGGSVADAATTLFFTLTATYPVAAGLGGGGVCLHYDPKARTAESIDFLPRAARAGGTIAVPGAIRGFAYLQARYGRKTWNDDILPAKQIAADGFMLSRALADALKAHSALVQKSALLSRLFVNDDGGIKGDGDEVSALELASTLAIIGARGANGLYSGSLASDILQSANSEGGALSMGDLLDYRADAVPASMLPLKTSHVLAAADKTGAGALAAAVIPKLAEFAGQKDPDGLARAARAAVSEALRAYDVGALPADFGSTSFIVADRTGEVVACGLTLSAPFGTAREVGRAGFALAPAPKGPVGLAGAFLTPLLVTGPRDKDIIFAGAGAGGPDAAATAFALALTSLAQDTSLIEPVWRSTEKEPGNHVNVIACAKNGLSRGGGCVAEADPAGRGVALQGETQTSGGKGFLGLGLF